MSAATGALQPILGKLATLLGDEYTHFKGLRKEIKSLSGELAAMEAFLLKMSEEEDPDVQDKVWMNEVRELSYDMEDVIDDFMQSVGDKDEKKDGFLARMKNSLGKMKARHRIGNEIQDLKKQIIEVGERSARYRSREGFSNTANASIDPRALAIFEHASKLVGIDEPKAEIIKLLTEENFRAPVKQQQPKIITIVGPGGMGKTTIANQVYQELKGQFMCQAFISVSRNPDMMNILRTILSQLDKNGFVDTKAGSIQQLLSNISNFLVDRSYFVVIDDIWKKEAWDVIKYAFPMTSCGIIITTTRIKDVANSCQLTFSGHIYNIRPLHIVHSRELFQRRLFNSKEDLPTYLEKVSDEILKKCDGLPLAIIAISGLLANIERTEDIWNQVKDSIGHALERNPTIEGMMKILSLSYFDLPPHLKTCLLYLSIFSEDSSIKKNDLIRRWIGEEFIHNEGRYTAHEIGERCFHELLNRGLIQPGMTDKYGKVKSCRVHDTILDFIISKSIEENFITSLGVPVLTNGIQNKVVRRLSLHSNQGNSAITTSGLVFSHVRSLNVFGNSARIPSLEEFRHLRVLDLKHCHQLEDDNLGNIVRLLQLRYLNLKSTRICGFPEQIGRLGCLVVLDLRGNHMMKELPTSIINLGKLSHLLVDNHVKFPDGIAKMQALETLKDVAFSVQPMDFLWGLGQLKNLKNLSLDLDFEDALFNRYPIVVQQERNKAIVSSLCKLGTQNLRSMDWISFIQEPLCVPAIEKLINFYLATPQIPKWVSSLRNLQQLHLLAEEVNQDHLCILGSLPTLLILHLSGEPNGKLRICGEVGFQFLRIFKLSAGYDPVDLLFEAGSMPKLEKLMFNSVCGVEPDSLDFGIENLPLLSTFRYEVFGNDNIVRAVRSAMERAASAHPNHPSLLFRRLGTYNNS
ncbi:hypothetical protein ZWY2020_023888 [Hordeum vulgare]|nr:hypothetical protein ZWY2020_023888 [Hordeum vulgare]